MPRNFKHLAFILFFITACSGVWLRAVPFMKNPLLYYENILHGHSHIAILGWAFFGVYLIFLAVLWPTFQRKQRKHATILAVAIFVVSVVMFAAFLYEGYALFSIIFSTVHIFVEYWAVYFIYRQLKVNSDFPRFGALFINGALITLVISSIGPFLLGYLGAAGLRESPFFDMSIYFFLHFQYNGWLFLVLVGLFIFILHVKKIPFIVSTAMRGFWIYFISLFPWYISSILWVDLGLIAKIVATIGSVGQFIGVIFIIVACKEAVSAMKTVFSKLTMFSVITTFALLFFKSLMELGLISSLLSILVFDTRSVIIGYLHLTLLGFVSIFILAQFQMMNIINTAKKSALIGMIIFLVGFVLNELILFISGLLTWVKLHTISYQSEILLLASIILAVGIVVLWVTPRRE